MAEEIWKSIPGFEGFYEVSMNGRVKSLPRIIPHARYGEQPIGEKILSAAFDKGYARLNLYKDGIGMHAKVHILVLTTFVGPRPKGHYAHHIDGDKSNNNIENLTWLPSSQHQSTHGKGEANSFSKLTPKEVRQIRGLLATGRYTHIQIAKRFNISRSNVGLIAKHKTWKHV